MYDYQADIRNPLRTHTVILYRYLLPIAILVNNAFKTVQQSAKTIFKCIHLYNIRNCFSVLYFLRPLHITEKENFTEIFH